ncbi:NAD(P)/FAD-dependent oxidoreductase [Hominifimenecus sp. rT4P-3]|uniref:NAD(P)/FAD-dependent oxidoreductase n=1 Tax=Hominifimenecus sp. rT4P-3 TaxID=3242979 RepID=UPI003DA6958A
MIQISNIKLPIEHKKEDLLQAVKKEGIFCRKEELSIRKLSLDARKKEDLRYVYTVEASLANEEKILKKCRSNKVSRGIPRTYQVPSHGSEPMKRRPIVIGAGPAGLFAALLLAENGYCPILLERGAPVEERSRDVERFWGGGSLDVESNVQFGEGGAGTFSDGKLNTQVKDAKGRIFHVLSTFVEAGADPAILYWNKPHIGTDVLRDVVKSLRERILAAGGEVWFHTKVTDFQIRDGVLQGLSVLRDGSLQELPAESVILAIGHSARDTFSVLEKRNVPMRAKDFAVGLRIEHPQKMIRVAQYGTDEREGLPVADYKLTAQTPFGRGVYSFCMCPGGQVVNASSEEGRLAVNGMSRAARDGRNANSALIVTVTRNDYPDNGPLAGVRFQRRLEEAAYQAGGGKIPVQLLADFREGKVSQTFGDIEPDCCGDTAFADLRRVLPEQISASLLSAMEEFGKKIEGFDRPDAVFSGVESRTSSPVRIERDEHLESQIKGLFPCGEGAGYAGGITSAAADGIRIAEELIRRYQPWT